MTFFSRRRRQAPNRDADRLDSSLVGWLGFADLRGRFVVFCGLALVYCFVLETSLASFLNDQHWWGISTNPANPTLITRVEPNGLAWDRSIRPGDTLNFDGTQSAITNQTELNTAKQLQVQRVQGPPITLQASDYDDQWTMLVPAAIGFFFFLAGGLVYVQATTRRQARAFALTCGAAALALSVYPAGATGQPWAIRLTFVCFALIPAFFAYLFFVFPIDLSDRTFVRRHLVRLLAILPLAALLAYVMALGGDWPAFSYAERASEMNMLLGILLGLFVLLRSYFGECTPRARQQLQIAVAGTLLGVFPFLVLSIAPMLLRPLQPSSASLQGYIVPPGVTILATVIVPLSFGYAILKHQLIQADVVIRRSVIYLAITLVTVVCYLLVVSAFTSLFKTVTREDSVITVVLAAFVVALVAEPIRRTTQGWVERVFFSDILAYRQLLNSSGLVLNSILNPNEIFKLIVGTITSALPVSHIALFILDREKGDFHLRWDQHGEHARGPVLGPDHPFVQIAMRHGQAVLLRNERPDLFANTAERAFRRSERNGPARQLSPNGASGSLPYLLVPLKTGGEMIAILSLGPRTDHDDYSGADLEFLDLAAVRYAVALDNALLHETVRNQADTDPLTGLYNHRYIFERLAQEIAIARERKAPLGVLMMDVNSFKFFNDTYGHPVGDQVLVTIGEMLVEVCHDVGIVGRYGGDEFVVILPRYDRSEAERIADLIASSAQSLVFHVGSPSSRDDETAPRDTLSLSLTIGVAAMPEHGESPLQLISAADVAMYGHKRLLSDATKTLPDIGDLPPGPLRVLMVAIQQKDGYVAAHSERAAHFAVRLGVALALNERELQIIRMAGLLHDIGKLGVPERILNKAGKLTPEERRLIEGHVDLSVRLIADLPNRDAVIDAIHHHHERWDGHGYPRGIAGEAIPLSGRILAVSDVYSALTTDRPYRHRMTPEGAAEWIASQSGTQFDARVVDALLAVLGASEDFHLSSRDPLEAASAGAASGNGRASGPSRQGQERSSAAPRPADRR